jgi:multidrug efflux pump
MSSTTVVNRLLPKLQALPQLADVVTDQQLDGVATTLTIDRATASRFGITPSTIDNTLYDAFGQRQINTIYTQVNQYHVILEADPSFQRGPGTCTTFTSRAPPAARPTTVASNTAGSSSGAGSGSSASSGQRLSVARRRARSGSSLSATSVRYSISRATPRLSGTTRLGSLRRPPAACVLSGTSGTSAASQSASASNSRTTSTSGAGGSSSSSRLNFNLNTVPLSAFMHMQTQSEPLSIGHQGQFPVVTFSFNLGAGYSLGEALDAINEVIAKEKMPPV